MKSWWHHRSRAAKIGLVAGTLIAAFLLAVAVVPAEDTSSTGAPEAAAANIYLVASKSFCRATGVDDAYTGDGHVTFFLTFRNTGGEAGSVGAAPVRHYDDGEMNSSALDAVTADVAANQVESFHTAAMKYSAHSHEITGCGVVVDGREEVAIGLS